MNLYILAALTAVFSLHFHQPEIFPANNSASPFSYTTNAQAPAVTRQIKWTWQLPREVRNAFNKSVHADLYIEKMIRFESGDKTFFRFYLNNGDLLDGDHHDAFLQSVSVDIASNGMIIRN
ncbi:MAG TPA: hypothetical protein VNT20_15920 [Flavisolibacter sp.]|jgi:hypothetical protein|nr:hypothetical protein [Flavisolibacter sp.]